MRLRLFLLLWLLGLSPAFAQLKLEKPQWGFNGTVLKNSFNILSVQVQNTGAQAFEGDLTLEVPASLGMREAAPCIQSVFISPGTSRTVQFYPYITASKQEYRITWKGTNGVSVDGPDTAAPAVVMLADLDSNSVRGVRMPVFHEGNFPPTVAATDALNAVVLDHQPKWDPARREAFLDWVKQGGIVHLIHGLDGKTPEFSEDMAVLNVPGDRGAVGAGLVVKHTTSRAEITQDFLRNAGFPAPELPQQNGGYAGYDYYDNSDSEVFRMMAEVTKPNIAWGTIYTLTFVYIGLIGPVFYFQRRRDYRMLLGAFVATVAIFAWIFTVVGRRGYGEKQLYHSYALARSIEGDKWDVRQWMYPFATSGDKYRFNFPGGPHLYSANSDTESVRGEFVQGKDGGFIADIPLFSSRPFMHQGALNGPKLDAKIETKYDIVPERVSFADTTQARILGVVIQTNSHLYKFNKTPNGWDRFQSIQNFSEAFSPAPPNRLSALIIGNKQNGIPPVARPPEDGRARLYIYAETHGTFELSNTNFQAGKTYVLFVQDLPISKL